MAQRHVEVNKRLLNNMKHKKCDKIHFSAYGSKGRNDNDARTPVE